MFSIRTWIDCLTRLKRGVLANAHDNSQTRRNVGLEEMADEEELPELVPVTADSPQPCGIGVWESENKLVLESLFHGMPLLSIRLHMNHRA